MRVDGGVGDVVEGIAGVEDVGVEVELVGEDDDGAGEDNPP